MGRRALGKIPSDVHWEPYLTTVDELPSPWSDEALFGRAAPLEVEMGSGKGLFIENASRCRPEHNFLGLEVSQKYARFSAAQLAKHQRENAKMVFGDGLRAFREFIPDESVTAIHVYFPDPWWKTRHRHRRVLRQEFIDDIVRTLLAGGSLHFWTDVRAYFEATLALLAASPLEGPCEVPEPESTHEFDFRTHFERRTRLHDEPVYRAEYRKKA